MLKKIRSHIVYKIALVAILGVFVMGISSIVFFAFKSLQLLEGYHENLSSVVHKNSDEILKSHIQNAISLIDAIHKKELEGEYSHIQAYQLATDLLRELRYGKNGYFWADTKEGVNIVYKGSETEGENRIGLKDVNGKLLIKEIIEKALAGGGYTEYLFPKDAKSTQAFPKRSYSQYYEPYNLVVGTGIYTNDLNKFLEIEKQNISQSIQGNRATMIMLLTSMIILFGFISIVVGKKIATPIEKLSGNAKLMADGDLNVQINTNQTDEIGDLQKALFDLAIQLKLIVEKINKGISIFKQTEKELSNSSLLLSESANQQAASSEEISSSMEEMATAAQQNNRNAQEATVFSSQLQNEINDLKESYSNAMNVMRSIVDDIAIVNEISEKTDILAINAAIEAARAGAEGKGFSVVAAEIRKLAEKSKKTADNIFASAHNSLQMTEITWDKLEAVFPKMQRNIELVQEIAASSAEQSTGINQVSNATQELSQIAAQNNDMASGLTVNIEQIEKQINELNQILDFFKL